MFFQKDDLSKFDFISIKEFILALFLMFVITIFSFLIGPNLLKKVFPVYSHFFDSHYFGIFVFLLSSVFNFYIIYFFACKKRQKTLRDGLFFHLKSAKTILISALLGIGMPVCTLPIIFKYAPHDFYAVDLVKTKDGMIYLFSCALTAPIFEEIFYRGFIFPFFQSKLNSFWAVTITSLFFGFSHFMNVGNVHILLSLFIFYGFVLTLIRYFTNSLIPPIVTHFVHNVVLICGFLMMSS